MKTLSLDYYQRRQLVLLSATVARLAAAGMLAIAVSTFLAARAQSEGGTIYLFGKSGSSCGEYLRAVESERKARPSQPESSRAYSAEYAAFVSFADGYLTGVNVALGSMAGSGTELWGRMAWLEDYCRRNPLEIYLNALTELRRYLVAHRQ
jgi:hypothetical protein